MRYEVLYLPGPVPSALRLAGLSLLLAAAGFTSLPTEPRRSRWSAGGLFERGLFVVGFSVECINPADAGAAGGAITSEEYCRESTGVTVVYTLFWLMSVTARTKFSECWGDGWACAAGGRCRACVSTGVISVR